jgi:hypothetical protein
LEATAEILKADPRVKALILSSAYTAAVHRAG